MSNPSVESLNAGFKDVAELTQFLRGLDWRYAAYADPLWASCYHNVGEIAAAERTDLEMLGIPRPAVGYTTQHCKQGFSVLEEYRMLKAQLQQFEAVIVSDSGSDDQDTSTSVVERLLSPPLQKLPEVDELPSFLWQRPVCELAVLENTFKRLQRDASCAKYMECFTRQHSAAVFAEAASRFLDVEMINATGEDWTAYLVISTLVEMLKFLDDRAASDLRVGLIWERDEGDLSSEMASLSHKMEVLRPDGVIRHADSLCMLLKWEERSVAKTATWLEVYYGLVDYLLTFAAAGSLLQYVVLRREACGTPKLVGSQCDLSRRVDRVELLMSCVQLHGFLRAMATALRYPRACQQSPER